MHAGIVPYAMVREGKEVHKIEPGGSNHDGVDEPKFVVSNKTDQVPGMENVNNSSNRWSRLSLTDIYVARPIQSSCTQCTKEKWRWPNVFVDFSVFQVVLERLRRFVLCYRILPGCLCLLAPGSHHLDADWTT
jgi:hypothetical protein